MHHTGKETSSGKHLIGLNKATRETLVKDSKAKLEVSSILFWMKRRAEVSSWLTTDLCDLVDLGRDDFLEGGMTGIISMDEIKTSSEVEVASHELVTPGVNGGGGNRKKPWYTQVRWKFSHPGIWLRKFHSGN